MARLDERAQKLAMFTLQVFNEGPGRPIETVTVNALSEVAVRVPHLMVRHPNAARIVVSAFSTRLFQVDCRRPSAPEPAPRPSRTRTLN